ncbi:MAG: WbqC family protein [Bacteroidales bacterium]|nr:WbqC family protein [Bacteroidales bacterium]
MTKAILSTAFLAPVEYYSKIYNYDEIWIEACDNFIKQTYRNRCFIGAVNLVQNLSIPIEKGTELKTSIKDVRLSEHGNWRHQHWFAIRSTYNNTPFFEYYEDDFAPFFEKRFDFLFDLNEQLRELICSLIGIEKKINYTTEYLKREEIDGSDFREIIHPKRDYKELDKEFIANPYYQTFQDKWGFRDNLSVIDLLFNMGPESILVLKNSIKR